MSWLRWLLIALWALGTLGNAAAHASLMGTVPRDGAALQTAPAEVVLEFDESVAPLALRLVDAQGTPLALSNARSEGTRVRVPLPALRDGAFVISYRVASADSHPVAGSIAFTIGAVTPASRSPDAAAPPGPGLDTTVVAARIVRNMVLLTALGAALFAALVGRFPHQQAAVGVAVAAAAVAAAAELVVQGIGLAGPQASLHEALVMAATTTAVWSAVGIGVGLALILPGAWRVNGAGGKALLLLGASVIAAGVGLTGHAASSQHRWGAMVLVACHVLAAGFWFGSLGALLLSLSGDEESAFARTLRRFSAIAMPAVAVLLIAGGAFATMQLDSFEDLGASTYGSLVLVKLALLLPLVMAAAVNRFVLTARVERGDHPAKRWLRRSIQAELVLLAAVLVVTGFLSRSPPPVHASAPITRELAGATSMRGTVTVAPGRAGRNRVVVVLRDSAGALMNADDLTLQVSQEGVIESLERQLQPVAKGTWQNEEVELFFPGTWRVVVAGRTGEFDRFTLEASIRIR